MKPTVYMMLGLPGSGKTTFSKQLQLELGLDRLSIDEEYSKLGGNLHDKNWDKKLSAIAGDSIKKRTAKLVSENKSVILDLCPWIKEKRDEYREYIKSIGATCHIYYFDVDKKELLQRLTIRNKSGKVYYIISPEMLDDFIEEFNKPIGEGVELIAKQST